MAQKKTSDEMIVAALLERGTVKAAAAVVGLTPRAVYERMIDGEFQALYKAAKTDIVRDAVHHINARLQEAVDTVAEIMNDKEINPAVRLQAAQTIITNAARMAERLTAEEVAMVRQADSNMFAW